jgi:hypothetical protein
MFSENPP